MPRLVLLRPLLPLLLVASRALAADAPAAAASPEPPAPASFSAEGALGSVDDMNRFTDEFWAARFDLTRAAKVENLVVQVDAAKFTLTGWVFKKAAVRGITSRALFFGTGRLELTPPIAMERQQVKRFLGSESIDQPLAQCRFDFNGADQQAIFDALSYVPEAAAEARERSEEAREWLDEVAKIYARALTPEQEAPRKLEEYQYALAVYERLLDPRIEGSLAAQGKLPKLKAGESRKSTLASLTFVYSPDEDEEVSVYGGFDHGDGERWSILTTFACCDKYAGDLGWAATSPLLEAQRKDEVAMDRDTLRIQFDPGNRPDMRMTSTMDLRILADGVKMLEFGITPYLGATKCQVDGADAGFSQPAIPGVPGLHVGTIIVPLARAYSKGEKVSVRIDVEGKILANIDGATWIVKEEDAWFPSPPRSIGAARTVFDTTLIAPASFTAVSNGAEQPCEGDVPEGQACSRYVTNTGISFAAFNLGRDIKVAKGAAPDGTPIHIYAPVDLSKTSESMLQNARLSHAVYEEWFGQDPYDRLYLTPHPKGHGRGSASLLLLYVGAFYSATQWNEMASLSGSPYEPWRMLAFVSHEIAHQWWGGAAGIRGSRDQWFSEGFADYGCNMVLEAYDATNGTNWRGAQLKNFETYLTKDDGYVNDLAPLALGNRVDSPENRDGYEYYRQNYMYSKGAFVMHMLRTIARAKLADKVKGDDLFKQAVHDFMESCRGRDPSNLDLMKSFETSYGMRLDWFFKQWVFGTGLPKVEFSYQVTQAPDGKGHIVRGRVKQRDTAWIFPVAVSFQPKGGKGEAPFVYRWIQKADDTFEFPPIPFQPEKVTINEDHGLLAIVTPVAWTGPSGS